MIAQLAELVASPAMPRPVRLRPCDATALPAGTRSARAAPAGGPRCRTGWRTSAVPRRAPRPGRRAAHLERHAVQPQRPTRSAWIVTSRRTSLPPASRCTPARSRPEQARRDGPDLHPARVVDPAVPELGLERTTPPRAVASDPLGRVPDHLEARRSEARHRGQRGRPADGDREHHRPSEGDRGGGVRGDPQGDEGGARDGDVEGRGGRVELHR